MTRHSLLALLTQGPRYGYQLRSEFEERTGATWPLNIGQVYTTLDRLERDGLVEDTGDDGEGHREGDGHRSPPAGGSAVAVGEVGGHASKPKRRLLDSRPWPSPLPQSPAPGSG